MTAGVALVMVVAVVAAATVASIVFATVGWSGAEHGVQWLVAIMAVAAILVIVGLAREPRP